MQRREERLIRSWHAIPRYRTATESLIVQFVNEPKQLALSSFFRALVAVHYRWFSGESTSTLYFLSVFMLTAVVWQCYVANTLASIKVFLSYWASFTPRQRKMSLFLGVVVLCAPLFVANGLLEFAHGLPPSVPMRVFNFLPAMLWTIPVVLYSALGLFQTPNRAQLKQMQQMQEVVTAHLITMPLYFIFVMNSKKNDAVICSSGTTVLGMLGVTLIGFFIQCWYMRSYRPLERFIIRDIERERLDANHFEVPQAAGPVELEEQSTSPSELVLSPIDTPRAPAGHELVSTPPYKPLKLSDKDKIVIHSNKPVQLRCTPDAVLGSPSRIHSFVSQ